MFADYSENANPKPCAERRKIGFLGLGAVCVYIKLMEHGQEGKTGSEFVLFNSLKEKGWRIVL